MGWGTPGLSRLEGRLLWLESQEGAEWFQMSLEKWGGTRSSRALEVTVRRLNCELESVVEGTLDRLWACP